jgi:CRP-like cAMP-binding protein
MNTKLKDDLWEILNELTPMSEKEFEKSYKLFKPVRFSKGDYFVRCGEVCRQIAFIGEGVLRTYYINDKGDEITICFCSEKRFTTSFKSLITQQPSQLNIQALEATQIITLAYKDLQKLYVESKSWQTIGRLLAEREYLSMESYAVALNRETAKEKYTRLLKEQPQVIQRAPVQQIASYLGITRETLSRIRRQIAN